VLLVLLLIAVPFVIAARRQQEDIALLLGVAGVFQLLTLLETMSPTG